MNQLILSKFTEAEDYCVSKNDYFVDENGYFVDDTDKRILYHISVYDMDNNVLFHEEYRYIDNIFIPTRNEYSNVFNQNELKELFYK